VFQDFVRDARLIVRVAARMRLDYSVRGILRLFKLKSWYYVWLTHAPTMYRLLKQARANPHKDNNGQHRWTYPTTTTRTCRFCGTKEKLVGQQKGKYYFGGVCDVWVTAKD
jgi:hypothetical protein